MTEQIAEQEQRSQRTIMAKVVSDKMNKTAVVLVERKVRHPRIGKYVKRSTKMYVDDPENTCHIGDLVLIKQCRPLSKTKRWVLVEIVRRETL